MTVQDIPDDLRYAERQQSPASIMVWACVTSCGKKGPLIFIQPGVKIDQHYYLDMIQTQVKPWLDAQQWPAAGYKFQQDSTPSHAANLVQQWMDENLVMTFLT